MNDAINGSMHDALAGGLAGDDLESTVLRAAACCGATVLSVTPPDPGSRRRRLWELDGHAHCPVVGVCLPIAALRRVVDKVLGGQAVADDYELHCGAITECKRRSPIAEAMQKELDRRCAPALRQAASAKTTESLGDWWRQASHGNDVPGALWATLTHARCTPGLEHQVLGEVHMLQHQLGSARRLDQGRFDAMLQETTTLRQELIALQQRHQRHTAEQARLNERLQEQLMRARADLIGRDTVIAGLREELATLEASVPGLKSRIELSRHGQRQNERLVDLERALMQSQQEAERQRRRADEATAALDANRADGDAAAAESAMAALPEPAPPQLTDCAVLCVGGRPASVPLYRHIVERTGGHFLHHDGGEEQSTAQLDATLGAADLVICQTGCISHDAYWRVKDHCKRHGKPCVFVEKPGSASLKRALAELRPIGIGSGALRPAEV
ncbi:DUF2325 domain-containing protein [soil metagenome]